MNIPHVLENVYYTLIGYSIIKMSFRSKQSIVQSTIVKVLFKVLFKWYTSLPILGGEWVFLYCQLLRKMY